MSCARLSKLQCGTVLELYAPALVMVAVGIPTGSAALRAQQIHLESQPLRVTLLDGRWPLGVINYVTTDAQERALVLGGPSQQQLFVLTRDGKSVMPPANLPEIGAPLAEPVAAAFDGASSIVVIDGQGPGWARLTMSTGRWAVDTLSSTNLSRVSSMCSTGGRRYAMGKVGSKQAAGVVHELTTSGEVIRSFGTPFGGTENPAVAHGHLLCLETLGLIIVASRLYPELRAYTMTGAERWTVRLQSFQPMGFEVEGRLVRFALPPDSIWDQTVSLFPSAPDVIAAQVGRIRGRAASRYIEVRTLLLSARSGRFLASQVGLPIVKAATSETLYAVAEEHAHELQIYSYSYRAP